MSKLKLEELTFSQIGEIIRKRDCRIVIAIPIGRPQIMSAPTIRLEETLTDEGAFISQGMVAGDEVGGIVPTAYMTGDETSFKDNTQVPIQYYIVTAVRKQTAVPSKYAGR